MIATVAHDTALADALADLAADQGWPSALSIDLAAWRPALYAQVTGTDLPTPTGPGEVLDHHTTTVDTAAAWQALHALPADDERPSARELKEDER